MMKPASRRHFVCRVCASSGIAGIFVLKEMMYGTREAFEYAKCDSCECLQMVDIPADMARYYPADYYSMQPRQEPTEFRGFKRWVAQWYCRSAALQPSSGLRRAIRGVLPMPADFALCGKYLIESRLRNRKERILDVGCGASPYLLAAMRRCGFTDVQGADPFIQGDLTYEGVPVRKCSIDQLEGEYGLIMLHHSLEHMPDPGDTLRHVARLLRTGGTCLVRVPVMGTYFWRRFGEHWVELDPPRHLYSFSADSLRVLGGLSGLSLRETFFDSGVWELTASIQYERGVPLRSDIDLSDLFSPAELADFKKKVDELNEKKDAGRACFYFERS